MQTEAPLWLKVTVGVFILVGLLTYPAFLILFGKIPWPTGEFFRLGGDSNLTLHVAFRESVFGLREGSKVTYSGLEVGTVREIRALYRSSPAAITLSKAMCVLDDGEITGGAEAVERWLGPNLNAQTSNRIPQHADFPHAPPILVTVQVDRKRCPISNRSSAVLEMVNLLGGEFTVRIEPRSAVNGSLPPECSFRRVEGAVLVAELSPVARAVLFLKPLEMFLTTQRGIELASIVSHAEQIGRKVDDVLKTDQLSGLLEAHGQVARRLAQWTDPAGGDARVTRILQHLEDFAENADLLVDPAVPGGHANLPTLVATLQDLGESAKDLRRDLSHLATSVDGLVGDNRDRLARLMDDTDQLARRTTGLIQQLREEPSSAVWGRSPTEIGVPFR